MKTNVRYIPLLAVNVYVLIGMSVSFFGPLEYVQYEKLPVFVYIFFFVVFFSLAYTVGVNSRLRISRRMSEGRKKKLLQIVFRACLLFAVLFMTYEFFYSLFVKGYSFRITDSGAAYVNSYFGHIRNSGNYSLNFLFLSIGAVPIFITQIWGLLYFESLPMRTRILVLYVFVMTVFVYTIGGGKQKQFGDILIYLITIFLIKRASIGQLNLRAIAKMMAYGLGGVYVLLVLLAFRYDSIGIDLSVLNQNLHPLIYYDGNNLLERIFGEVLAFPIVMLSGYLGQGYYGLSLAMQLPFTWSYFGGSSYSFSVILNKVFGTDFLVEKSYPYLVADATGWAETKWHTLFSWLASDLTFPGTIFFLSFVGYYFGRSWKESIISRNPFSTLLFVLLCIGAFYIPANNQLMHSPGGLWLLGCVIFLYSKFSSEFNFL